MNREFRNYVESTLLGLTIVILLSLVFLTWIATIPQYSRFSYYYLFFFLSSISLPFIITYFIYKSYNIPIQVADILDIDLEDKGIKWAIIGSITGFLFGLVARFGTYGLRIAPKFIYGITSQSVFQAMIAFNIGLNEELFFRGLLFGVLYWVILLPSIKKGKVSKNLKVIAFLFASIVNSILFAFYHAYVYGMNSSLVFLFIFGMIMSIIRYYGDIWGSIMFHAMYDLVFFLVI